MQLIMRHGNSQSIDALCEEDGICFGELFIRKTPIIPQLKKGEEEIKRDKKVESTEEDSMTWFGGPIGRKVQID